MTARNRAYAAAQLAYAFPDERAHWLQQAAEWNDIADSLQETK